ncbi:AraC family transcriptional regulator [Sinorhizobium meliloti]|uniref:AraC family transcriptional regulator n=1 Tax=Rhizobium meliloti TaxID=382 RepID=UPI000FD76395|nr:AraC family transcriptional regulator [Sinorhizobium meliloti]RVH34224.1 AraC family transcriptional regulator [Sinorhizobium meliloti]
MFAHALTNRVLAYADQQSIGHEPFCTDIPGLLVARHFRPTDLTPVLYRPIFCLVLQGAKQSSLGDEMVTFSQGQSVIVGLDLPTYASVVDASRQRPYVALALQIDIALIKELAAEIDDFGGEDARDGKGRVSAIAAGEADEAIVNAMERLFGLLNKPAAAAILRPSLVREIHFWLLLASHGALLRQLVQANSHAARISEAIIHIRRNYAEPLRIPELARAVGMSESAFHQHFKAICGTTPLQFQKRLRLIEAARLMTSENQSVSAAAVAVGYESPTQFSREFSRMFGLSPREHRSSISIAHGASARPAAPAHMGGQADLSV